MDDRDNGTGLGWVDVLVCVPGSGSGTCFGLTVTDNAGNDEIGFVHDGTEGDAEGVPKLTTFVDGAWSSSVDMTSILCKIFLQL